MHCNPAFFQLTKTTILSCLTQKAPARPNSSVYHIFSALVEQELRTEAQPEPTTLEDAATWGNHNTNDIAESSSRSYWPRARIECRSSSEPQLPRTMGRPSGSQEQHNIGAAVRPSALNDIPRQVFHDQKRDIQKECLWDPFGSLSDDNCELQSNRGFSGFSQAESVFRNNVHSGPFNWTTLQKAAISRGFSSLTHFIENALYANSHPIEDILSFDVNAGPSSQALVIMLHTRYLT
ncbi:uncharacterized protein RAG0_06886 [Rhynchosporium agropyri]|uniref:Uncharacterized protein n=1 Tax=Rhynchosporium agropyri TaxID=914238 RepID=A0A1E1KMB0_9HELO|nr:uncharacterized protein RAG0_06886 [Rhynchosporium agropyri]